MRRWIKTRKVHATKSQGPNGVQYQLSLADLDAVRKPGVPRPELVSKEGLSRNEHFGLDTEHNNAHPDPVSPPNALEIFSAHPEQDTLSMMKALVEAIREPMGEHVGLDNMPELLTVAQAAVVLQVGEGTVRQLLKHNGLRGKKLGRGWRVSKKAIRDFVDGM